MLLQAKINKNAITNIQTQINNIAKSLSPIKIKIEIDKDVLTNIRNINNQLKTQIHNISPISSMKTSVGELDKYIQTTEQSTGKLLNVVRDINLGFTDSLKVIDVYDKKTGDLVSTTDQLTVNLKKERDELKKIADFQQRMLGDKDFRGEIDIFASKFKGRYDITELKNYRKEVENLSNIPLEKQTDQMSKLKTQFQLMGREAMQSSNIITKTFENMYKFLRYYLVAGFFVSGVREIKKSIDFIKELDKDLTQVSITSGLTREETKKLAQSYVELGKEMGKTVVEISKVNTELVRQGLSIQESQQRMDTILKLSATGRIPTEQALKIITSSVNALGEEAEHTADVMLKASQISASSVEEIGEAYTKMASSAKIAEMSMTEINATISGLVEFTQESPSSLGNSVKTLISRFNKINAETGELNENFNDVQKAFESVGIAFLDADGQIRPVFQLWKDLAGIWGDLDKNTKSYISTQAAGIRQQNRFAALIGGFNRVLEINNELTESGNTLNESYSIYLNSVEAAANKASVSLSNLWINAINSDLIRDFYLLSANVLDSVDKIGLLKTTVTTLSLVFLLANKRWRDFAKSLITGEIFKVTGQLSMLSNEVNILGISFDMIKLKAFAAKVVIASLQAVLTLGLSVAISLVVDRISKMINKTNELRMANSELIQSFKQNIQTNNENIKRLKDLSNAYDNIKNKIINNIELNKEEKSILDEIIDINPSLIKGYNEHGDAIVDVTQSIDNMIESLESANELEDIKLLRGGKDLFLEATKDIEENMKALEDIKQKIEDIESPRVHGTLTKDSLMMLEIEYKKIAELMGENSEQALKLKDRIVEKEIAINDLRKEMGIYREALKTNSAEVQNVLFSHARLSDSYKTLTNEGKRFVGEFINRLNVFDFKNFIEMQIAVDEFVDALKKADFKKVYKEYSNLVDKFKNGTISAEEFDEIVAKIIEKLLTIEGIDEDLISKFFKDSSGIEDYKDEVTDFLEETNKYTKQHIEDIEELSNAYNTLNEGKNLSSKQIMDLVEKYPQLQQSMKVVEGQLYLEKDAIMTVMEAEEIAFKDKIKIYEQEAIAHRNSILAKLSLYGAEVKTIGDVIIARKKLAESYGMMKDLGINIVGSAQHINLNLGKFDSAAKQLEEIEGRIRNLQSVGGASFRTSSDTKTSKSTATKDSRQFLDSMDAEIRAIKIKNDNLLKTRDLLKEQYELAKKDNTIEGIKKQHELIGKTIENNTQIVQSFKHEQDLLHQRANELRKEYAQYDIDSWFDTNAEQTMAYIDQYNKATKEQQEEMGEIFTWVQKLKKAWMEANDEIKVANSELVVLNESVEELRQQSIDIWIKEQNQLYQEQQDRLRALEQIQERIVAIIRKRGEEEKKILTDNYNKEMKLLEDRHKTRMDNYKEELDEFKKLIQGKIDALDEQYAEEDYQEQLEKERLEAVRLQKEIDVLSLDDTLEARNKVIELRKKLAEQNEKIVKLQQKRERDLLKKSLQDQLKDKEKDVKDREKIADDVYNNERRKLEEEYEINKEYLERRYSDEQVYAEARKSIMRGQVEVAEGVFEDIYDAFVDFENKFGKGMGILGDIIKNDFIRELEKAQDAIARLDYEASNLLPQYDSDYKPTKDDSWKDPIPSKPKPESKGGKVSDMTPSDYNIYVLLKETWEMAKKQGNQEAMDEIHDSAVRLRKKYNIKEDLYDYNYLKNLTLDELRKREYGYKFGGKITDTGTLIAPFHGTKGSPEWILNDAQLRKTISNVTLSTVSAIIPKLPTLNTGQMIRVEKLINVEGNMTRDVLPLIEKAGNKVMDNLQKTLNKGGVVRPVKV